MEYSGYSEVSPQWTKFTQHYTQLAVLDKFGIVDRRRITKEIEATLPTPTLPEDVQEASLTVQSFTITARDGYDIPVRNYVPASTAANRAHPLLVYLHAGGFLFGDLESGDMNCRILSYRLDISILNVGYRLAPKWKFPHGLNDSYDATAWAAANAATHLHASPSAGFFVGGISAGANFAGVIAYLARDADLSPPITGLFLSIPVCIMPDAYSLLSSEHRDQLRSFEQNAENELLTSKSLGDIEKLYGAPPSDPRISFLLNEDHSRLPKRLYLQICGRDPLRDETFLWEKLVRESSGSRSKVHIYQGMPHGFWRFLQMEASRTWIEDLVEGVGFLLESGKNEDVGDVELEVKAL